MGQPLAVTANFCDLQCPAVTAFATQLLLLAAETSLLLVHVPAAVLLAVLPVRLILALMMRQARLTYTIELPMSHFCYTGHNLV